MLNARYLLERPKHFYYAIVIYVVTLNVIYSTLLCILMERFCNIFKRRDNKYC